MISAKCIRIVRRIFPICVEMAAIKILQLTDLHILPHASDTLLGINTEYYFLQTLAQAFADHGGFDLILLSGDLAQEPCAESYQRIQQHLQAYQTPCICLPGNHDDAELMRQYLNDGALSCAPHWVWPSWQLISLNSQQLGSQAGRLSADELAFLERTLSEYPQPAVLAMHHHGIASQSLWMDSMQIENSDELLALVARFPQVKAISCGHMHQEMLTIYHGVGWFATPATCFQFKPYATEFELDDKPPGYRVFELFDDGRLLSACYRIDARQSELQCLASGY